MGAPRDGMEEERNRLRESNSRLLDQNARLTTRVSLLELACEAVGVNPLEIRDEATLEAWAAKQQAKKASKVHENCMIGRTNARPS